MCGRYAILDIDQMQERFLVDEIPQGLTPQPNASPGMMLPVITKNSPRRVRMMKWGLIPAFARDLKIGNKMINARIETLSQKISYRRLLNKRRCVVPANGFFEWQKKDGQKQKYYFHLRHETWMALAGLYDEWVDAEGVKINSFTIITRAADEVMRNIHDRMPVILRRDQEEEWLSSPVCPPLEKMQFMTEIVGDTISPCIKK